jgi:hypothetical protein
MSVKLFICYAHEDELLVNKLKSHLVPLQRQGLIDVWYDRDISAGAERAKEIDKHLSSAQIILLIISANFMSSDYCFGVELAQAIERHESRQAYVIPVILRPANWKWLLGKFEPLPKDGNPVAGDRWRNIDEALLNISEGIHRMINSLPQELLSSKKEISTATQIQDKENVPVDGILTASFSPEQSEAMRRMIEAVSTVTPRPNLSVAGLYANVGEEQERFYAISTLLSIGRSGESNIFLEDLAVSRKHASVYHDNGHYILEDVGSSTGTIVNGKLLRKKEKYYLSDGDKIRVGKTIFIFKDKNTN